MSIYERMWKSDFNPLDPYNNFGKNKNPLWAFILLIFCIGILLAVFD
jgi:hypothetical protein